jgi:hypothetical protein
VLAERRLPDAMTPRRGTAVAITLLGAALATAGCGLGPGKQLGGVELTVTREYGSTPMLRRAVGDVTESDTAMRVLEREARISTRYGGRFVQSIEGVEAEERFSRSLDWFYYVNGVEAGVGAADYRLRGGESIWWDYRDWGAAVGVPAVVGSWPEPFLHGYDGHRHPVVVECDGGGIACEIVGERLRQAGVSVDQGAARDAIRVLVGPWGRVRDDPAAAQIEKGPEASGVFADFEGTNGGEVLVGLGEDGRRRRVFGPEAGLVAATRRDEEPPAWVVTGATVAAVQAAARLLDSADLRDRYAAAVEAGREEPLPLR